MKIGELRHRVTLQKKSVVKDGEGIPTETWADVCSVMAAVEPLRGREYFVAAAANAENTIRVRIRYRSDVTADMRVLYGTRLLQIKSPPIDPEDRHRELHLMCMEVGVNG